MTIETIVEDFRRLYADMCAGLEELNAAERADPSLIADSEWQHKRAALRRIVDRLRGLDVFLLEVDYDTDTPVEELAARFIDD